MTLDKIKDTAEKSGADFHKLMQVWSEGDDRMCVVWVRVGPGFLQHVFVDKEVMNDPHIRTYLENESMWETNERELVHDVEIPGS